MFSKTNLSVPEAQSCFSCCKSTASHLNAEAHLHGCSHLTWQAQDQGPGMPSPMTDTHLGWWICFVFSVCPGTSKPLYPGRHYHSRFLSVHQLLEVSGAHVPIQLSALWFGHSRNADMPSTISKKTRCTQKPFCQKTSFIQELTIRLS